MSLPNYFDKKDHEYKDYQWQLYEAILDDGDVHQLAQSLVVAFIEDRCSAKLVKAWHDGSPHSESTEQALKAHIEPTFGLPANEEDFDQDHVEGAVAEYLWYYLYQEVRGDVVYSKEPDPDPTSGGGDSISIHRSKNGLKFRLWEIKKHTGKNLSSTVSNAFNQLEDHSAKYIAQMSTIEQNHRDQEIAQFFSQLPELWCEYSPDASIGVSVAIPERLIPGRCFTAFPNRFPNRVNERNPLQGMLKVVGDYSSFVRTVQEEAWKGL